MPGSPAPIANDVFKQRSAGNEWRGLLVAVVAHALLFALAPTMTIADLSAAAEEVVVITPLPELPPEPPELDEIQPPASPLFGDVDPDITIQPNTDLSDTHHRLPGPPPADRSSKREIDAFTPRDVNPILRNTREVQRVLERTYPPLLRDAGIGGTVVVWFYIDASGAVQETRLNTSSGHAALDRAALAVAEAMEFRPALLRSRPVPVWVSIPIVFAVD